MNKQHIGFALIIVLTLSVLLHLVGWQFAFDLHSLLFIVSRAITVSIVCIWAYYKNSLTTWILVSMLLGLIIGYDLPMIAIHGKVISKIFLRLVKTIVAPLLFGTLVVAIAGQSNMKQVGRLGWKSMLYFEIVTTLALFVGLVAINISQAGVGLNVPFTKDAHELPTAEPKTWEQIILHIFPENIAKSVAEGEILQVVIFSILFGMALNQINNQAHKTFFINFAESLSEIMFKFTNNVMKLAPLAVGAAMAYSVSHMGLQVLIPLSKLLLTLYAALLGFILLVLMPIALYFRINIIEFAKKLADPLSIAFATTSSEAALPKAMKCLEEMGISKKIIAFVMPMGYSFNLDGTTLYLALASVFVAQASGIQLTWEQQLLMVFTLMITSKGVAGVPRASLVILMGTLHSFNLPVEPVFIILGIDELMDMGRTTINVFGNCLATAVIAKTEENKLLI